MSHAVSGKLVVVTGGTSGIGFALAAELLKLDARVVILADRPESVETALDRLGGRSAQLDGYVCDIGNRGDVAAVGKLVETSKGVPDVLVNNAGFATYKTFEEDTADGIERLMNVNFCGAVRVTKAFIGGMVRRRSGQIINIASIAGAVTMTPNGLYSASKHGMLAWSKGLAMETARFGIHVGVVCPGRVETSFFDHESFKSRTHRKESELVIPMPQVTAAILETIADRRRLRFVPRYFGYLAWFAQALPVISGPLLNRLMAARVEALYRDKAGE